MEWLFDASVFVTRDCCGAWGDVLPWVYQCANAGTALAYYAIPAILIGFWWRRREVVKFTRGALPAFAAFILLCGTTHILNIVSFYWPAYRLFSLVEIATALISLYTVGLLVVVVPQLLKYKSPEVYAVAIAERDEALVIAEQLFAEQTKHLATVQKTAEMLQEEIEHLNFKAGKEVEVKKLRDLLHNLRGC